MFHRLNCSDVDRVAHTRVISVDDQIPGSRQFDRVGEPPYVGQNPQRDDRKQQPAACLIFRKRAAITIRRSR